MVRARGPVLIALSLLLGAGAAYVANDWIQRQAASGDGAQVPVVVAATEIPFGTKVEARHLRVIRMMAGTAPHGVFHDPAEVVGRVTTGTAMPGELLLSSRLVTHESGSALSAVVEPNMRALTVRVDDVVGVAGFLLPGNRVDVLASRKVEHNRASTETILHNVKVLAVDQTAATDKNQPVVVRAVTLEVTPAQAEIVGHKEEGSRQLTLRNPLDDEVPALAAVEPPPVAPAKRIVRGPVAIERAPGVTVIRGTQVKEQAANL
jgi:pilus assembly protein CpaB